jgi:predicted DNA repair protein MutK
MAFARKLAEKRQPDRAQRHKGVHVSIGLIALLDDVAALAKVAAASLDDIAGQAAKAGVKAAGVVIDDAAVTPRYVVGFSASRELPIVGKIALGSLRNKILILLPAALALSLLAPWAITPLLMLGGAYLCYEGTEKVFEALFPHKAHAHEAQLAPVAVNAQTLEDEKVASAIKTDFILSAEIMAITLAAIPEGSFVMRAVVLALVGLGITVAVYGAVALIVKADDAGVALAGNTATSALGGLSRALGRGLVIGMPVFLAVLAVIGTAAMVWVGGGIVVHGMKEYGLPVIEESIHHVAGTASGAVPVGAGFVEWLATAAGSGIVGLVIGAILIPLTSMVLAPTWTWVSGAVRPQRA